MMLSRIVEWYNFLKTGTQNCEYNIILTQVDKIDADLEEAIKISTWVSYSEYVFILYKPNSYQSLSRLINLIDSVNL